MTFHGFIIFIGQKLKMLFFLSTKSFKVPYSRPNWWKTDKNEKFEILVNFRRLLMGSSSVYGKNWKCCFLPHLRQKKQQLLFYVTENRQTYQNRIRLTPGMYFDVLIPIFGQKLMILSNFFVFFQKIGAPQPKNSHIFVNIGGKQTNYTYSGGGDRGDTFSYPNH